LALSGGLLDGYRRKVVGWALADPLRAELVSDARLTALPRRQPAAGLIQHRDHGCQDTSVAFGQRLQAAGLVPSPGTIGDGYAKAVVEAFFSSLKVDLVDRRAWPTRAAVRLAIFEAIEVWSNRQRLPSTLGHVTPGHFEALAQAGVAAEDELVRTTEATIALVAQAPAVEHGRGVQRRRLQPPDPRGPIAPPGRLRRGVAVPAVDGGGDERAAAPPRAGPAGVLP
jgi:hypothetical protein